MKTSILTLSILTLSLTVSAQWIKQASGFSQSGSKVSSFSIVDKNTAWAAGLPSQYTIYYQVSRTTDGGQTWNKSTLQSSPVYTFTGIHAFNKDSAWVVLKGWNGGLIYKTQDGGQTWTQPTGNFFAQPDGAPNFIYFFDNNNGVCGGNPNGGYWEIYTTANGGANWTRVGQSNIPGNLFNEGGGANKVCAKGDTIWFGTNAGRVMRSVDKGNTWTVAKTGFGYSSTALDIAFSDSNNGIAVDFNRVDSMLQTSNGGVTWTAVPYSGDFSGILNLCDDICFARSTSGGSGTYVATGYGSYFSTDKGLTWNTLDSEDHFCVAFYDDQTGYSGGQSIDSTSEGMFVWTGGAVGMKKQENKLAGVKLYPNPFSQQATLELPETNGEYALLVYDMLGNKVKEMPALSNRRITIDRENLTAGVYFYQLVNKEGTAATGKMIIE